MNKLHSINTVHVLSVINKVIRILQLSLFFIANLYCHSLYATTTSTQPLGDVISRISNNMPDVADLLNTISVIAGVIFVFLGIYKLKHLADMRNMMSGQADVNKAIILIAIGGLFIWSGFLIEAITYTIFGQNVGELQTRYDVVQGQDYTNYYRSLIQILQVVGLISFLRGLFVFSAMSRGQSQPGTFAKGVTHIIAGVLLINITAFMSVLRDTLGTSFSFGIS